MARVRRVRRSGGRRKKAVTVRHKKTIIRARRKLTFTARGVT